MSSCLVLRALPYKELRITSHGGDTQDEIDFIVAEFKAWSFYFESHTFRSFDPIIHHYTLTLSQTTNFRLFTIK